MMCSALKALRGNEHLRLEVRGANPEWPVAFKEEMRRAGHWLDFAPPAEFQKWLASADAFVVPMVFESTMQRRMETSFPSKLPRVCPIRQTTSNLGPRLLFCNAMGA